jgi:hypothetical protein
MPVQVLVSQLEVVAARHPRQLVGAPIHQRPIPPRRLRGIDTERAASARDHEMRVLRDVVVLGLLDIEAELLGVYLRRRGQVR